MKAMNKIQKTGLYLLVGLNILFFTVGCKKVNEVPPRNQGYINELIIPDPTILSPQERQLVNQQREEYNNL